MPLGDLFTYRDAVLQQLKRHEGLRLKPYRCTAGKLTIGYGRNLDDKGISNEEAEHLLYDDVEIVVHQCESNFSWFKKLNAARQGVVINMVFNLGLAGFFKFKKVIYHLSKKQYPEAALEMANSRWAEQVKGRAIELCDQMTSGKFNRSL